MAKTSHAVRGNISNVANCIVNGFSDSGVSCELVERVDRRQNGVAATTLVFEKYMWRAGNRASLTVTLFSGGETVYVDAIGSGGGTGVFFSFSWGAEDALVSTVDDILRSAGYLS